MDAQGLLSTNFGAAWHHIAYEDKMEQELQRITGTSTPQSLTRATGIPLEDYPSISVVERLNRISDLSNRICIRDRHKDTLAIIQTDHVRTPYDSLPETFVGALVAAEDQHFFSNPYGFEYNSFVRSIVVALQESITTLSLSQPRGTSTLTQQVAKMFVSHLDSEGQRYVARSVDRKIQELRLAAALRKKYEPEEILEVYVNHCMTSSYGLVGIADISQGLWGKTVSELTDAESVYLSRMVKWGMNYPERIAAQCRIDMPRIAEYLGWSPAYADTVLAEIENLTFSRPRRIHSDHPHLIDLANRYWQKFLLQEGYAEEELHNFDLLKPTSLIRRQGNLTIDLTIDGGVQKTLEQLVRNRGFGGDTTIVTRARVGSFGEDITRTTPPKDTLNTKTILTTDSLFTEHDRPAATHLTAGDTVITNIRYRALGDSQYRRSVFHYAHLPVRVDGQFFAYAMMDARTGELLATYSRDQIGSENASLFKRRLPNGSALAKPILNALLFDLELFKPHDRWSDTTCADDPDLPWHRTFYPTERGGWFRFHSVAQGAPPYDVHNYGQRIGGEDFLFNHLTRSNNILGVESAYRLSAEVFTPESTLNREYFNHGQFLYNIDQYETLRETFAGREITGIRLYKELCRILGVSVDHINDSLYSAALGTIELSLLEQMHLFNMLYDNTLRENPAEDPSLFVQEISLDGTSYPIHSQAVRYHPFRTTNSLRPTLLGLHKRLINTPADNLTHADLPLQEVSRHPQEPTSSYSPKAYSLSEPLSNFAKSGTTNNILRPFNAPSWSTERTTYGNWNAVLRLDMGKISPQRSDTIDVTIACIAEGNREYTGPTDGKSLHRYLTAALLHTAGTGVRRGYYHYYERYLRSIAQGE